jgi:hypothetical protein
MESEMRAEIEVRNRAETRLIRAALEDKEVRAFVKVVGALKRLSSNRARIRVLRFVADTLDEESKRKP